MMGCANIAIDKIPPKAYINSIIIVSGNFCIMCIRKD